MPKNYKFILKSDKIEEIKTKLLANKNKLNVKVKELDELRVCVTVSEEDNGSNTEITGKLKHYVKRMLALTWKSWVPRRQEGLK